MKVMQRFPGLAVSVAMLTGGIFMATALVAFAGVEFNNKLTAAMQLTPDAKGLYRATGLVKWYQIDQATLTTAKLHASVADGTVWEVYMYTSPLSLEPIYVGQVTFTNREGRMTVCSGEALAGYVVRVFDFDFLTVLEGTFQ